MRVLKTKQNPMRRASLRGWGEFLSPRAMKRFIASSLGKNKAMHLTQSVLAICSLGVCLSPASALSAAKGDFGGDLPALSSYFVGPRHPGESNYYFDMWNGTPLS